MRSANSSASIQQTAIYTFGDLGFGRYIIGTLIDPFLWDQRRPKKDRMARTTTTRPTI